MEAFLSCLPPDSPTTPTPTHFHLSLNVSEENLSILKFVWWSSLFHCNRKTIEAGIEVTSGVVGGHFESMAISTTIMIKLSNVRISRVESQSWLANCSSRPRSVHLVNSPSLARDAVGLLLTHPLTNTSSDRFPGHFHFQFHYHSFYWSWLCVPTLELENCPTYTLMDRKVIDRQSINPSNQPTNETFSLRSMALSMPMKGSHHHCSLIIDHRLSIIDYFWSIDRSFDQSIDQLIASKSI